MGMELENAAGGGGGGTGDVVGPASAVNNNIAVYDTTTGKLIKDGGSTIAQVVAAGAAAAPQGDVVGPSSATNLAIAVFDLTTGKLIKDGGKTIAQVLARANHTGTQLAATISDFATAAQAAAGEGIKGWITLNGTGTIAIIDSFNVTSIADNGTGDYTITWDTDFANANYCVVGIPGGGAAGIGRCLITDAIAAGTAQILSSNSAGEATDDARISVMAIGDQ